MEKPKILIVDDREENLVSLEMILSQFDIFIDKANSGLETLRKTQVEDYALVILDVQMPGMDGYETLSLMRKRKKTKYVPVIFVSAIERSDLNIIRGIETGAIDFIPKPIIPEILLGKVKNFLDLYFQREELNELLKKLEENNHELGIQREKAEEATRAKALFLANMSHEIRTPLNGIIGISKVLESSELNNHQKELVEIITTSGENLLNIINDILDFSKIEAKQIQLEEIEFNLRMVISNIVKLLRFNADKKGLELKVKIGDTIPELLLGDPYRLNQIITNLVNNAIKFTEKGSITVLADADFFEGDSVVVTLKVRDTGIGISEEGKQKLFKEFSQTESSITRKYGGTGLGLAICRNLVELMKGEIGVESIQGEGSEFWVKLTMKFLPNQEKLSVAVPLQIPQDIDILYAEDNAVNQRVGQLMLRKIGVHCEIAENGQVAFEMYKNNPYSVILMDMQMPVLDGVQATRKIRAFEKEAGIKNPAYIVAVTANVFPEDKILCMEAGMNDFVTKPFQESEIKNILIHAVGR
jgi:signal transduction histidine kinase